MCRNRKTHQVFKRYGSCCISPRISDQSLANDNTQRLATTETTAQHGNSNLFHFQNDQMTGQHDRQDERLTGQLPNRFGHCPLTGRYFEPCGIHFILKSSNQVLQNITLHIKYMYNRLEPQVKNNVKFADLI